MTRPLCDAHAHVAQFGRAMSFVHLETCANRQECLDRLADEARSRPGAGWLIGTGLRPEGWDDPTWPRLEELDRIAGERPCMLWCFDYHAIAANSAALRAAGISHDSSDPEGGVICRESGRLTGVVLEAAAHMVWSAVPEPSGAERRGHVLAGLSEMSRLGFTEVHDMHASAWLGPVLADLDDEGLLETKLLLYPGLDKIDDVKEQSRSWERDRIRLAGAKLFADGTLNSRTALMLDEYADPLAGHPRGKAMASPGEVRAAMEHVRSLGLGFAVHAIGDGAVRMVLDAYERVGPWDAGDFPALRIEHAELIDEADVPRFASLGVVCSVQPCHLLADIEALRRFVPHRLDRVLPLRELIDAGCLPGELLVFGSDVPIVRADPQDSIQAATTRRRLGMPENLAISPEQAIGEEESWNAFSPTA